ncbi:Quinonprotein alcohol dehydrogenase-like superfamily [Elaphomyces granulatus]
MPRRHREDYTVGWICALPIELAAAQEMLDEEHEGFDHDLYTLGRIGKHNVVIACLPKGQTGTNSAAAVAAQMTSAFISIRFGLMVGIGGGVPTAEADIRLGDVVVSQPGTAHGGVIQYDFGKATPGGFKRTGFLNTPPAILLNAVAKLQANHLRGMNRTMEYASHLNRLPTFAHQNTGPDVLFEANYHHVWGAACELCSKEKVVERKPRDNQEIVAHYGTIASGNQVMRDAAERDRVSWELGGVLCFEMEAAGLMNSFPCLVIRGICDYADSHKSKRWQAYAAGAAAAYAKELLSVIPPAEVAKSLTLDEIIKEKNVLEETLSRLPCANEAAFNSYQRQHEPTCLENTRGQVLQDICSWADGQNTQCVFWLNGLAGTGKSTIARTIARKYFEQRRLGASFFFTKGGGDTSHAGKFITSIAHQFASNIPPLQPSICEAITECNDIASLSLRDQWCQLVLTPLSKLDSNSNSPSYILVVDALDECEDDKNIRIILQLLTEARSLTKSRLRVFLTSRPEIPIRCGFSQVPEVDRNDFVLHNISTEIVDHDIAIFLEHELKVIAQELTLDPEWPGEEAIKLLVKNASGLFIWCATVCRFIREGGLFAEERLCILLNGSTSTTAPEAHLSEIYATVLQSSIYPTYTEQEKEKLCSILRQVLGSVVILSATLPISSLSRLLHIAKQKVDQILGHLHAILDIPRDQSRPLRLHHPSFRDFLLSKDRCSDPSFWVDEKQAHQMLTKSCIQLMSTSLKQDICDVVAPGIPLIDIANSRVDKSLPPEVQYACLYWAHHLHKSGRQIFDNSYIHQFLQAHLLHWLEALSWMRKMSDGILAINSLVSIALTSDCPQFCQFIQDVKRFAQYSRPVIEQAPLQVYLSALVFAPVRSLIRNRFQDQALRWIKPLPDVQGDWGALLQTLEGHTNNVRTIAFSKDGKTLASASSDHTVRLWDPATGQCLQTLQGHTGWVNAIVFSANGKMLASASEDSTVRLWDPTTGQCLQTYQGHTNRVNAIAFSEHRKILASASADSTVRLWDPTTGQCLQTLQGHANRVNVIVFSEDGKMLASASGDSTVRLWDPTTGQCLQMLEGHTGRVTVIVFSKDGKILASASWDCTVRLWDPTTGQCLQTLRNHTRWANAIAFSKDGKMLASASWDHTVCLWDPATGQCLQTLQGHTRRVNAIAFSEDGKMLASASVDSTVRLWDPTTGQLLQTLQGHIDRVNAIAFTEDGKMLASASADSTVRLWDPTPEQRLQTPEGHTDLVNALTFSEDGKILVSASADSTIRLWDPTTGQCQQTLQGHIDWVNAIAFSEDGKMLASASADSTVRLWDLTTGQPLQTLQGHTDRVNAITFLGDGKILASASADSTIRFWDSTNGKSLQTLRGHTHWVNAIAFSEDGKMLASASADSTVRLWDPTTAQCLQTLQDHTRRVNAIVFSEDGKMLASASADSTVRLWDPATGQCLQILQGHTDQANVIAFSEDGKMLASASADSTVRLWDPTTGQCLQTLKGISRIKALSFSNDDHHLYTDRGILILRPDLPSTLCHQQAPIHTLSVKETWVTLHDQNILWLPPEYRATTCIAVYNKKLALGYPSGQIVFFAFA